MNRILKKSYIILLITSIFLSGCLSELSGINKEVIVTKPVEVEQPPLSPILPLDILQRRIDFLKSMLQSDKLTDDDRLFVSTLLSDYEKIYDAAKNIDNAETIGSLFYVLEKLENRCFSEDKIKDKYNYSNVLKEYSSRKKNVTDKYLSEDYEGVITECGRLVNDFGPDSLTPEVGIVFSISLAKKGLFKEAVNIGERIISELEGRPDIIHLRAGVIDWLLQMGNKEKAKRVYEKLIDSLDERNSVYTKAKNKIEPEEAVSSLPEKNVDVENIIPEAHAMERGWIEEVNDLVKKGAFDDAKLFLLKIRLRTEDPSELELIDKTLINIEQTEENKDEAATETAVMEQSIRLIEEENYEEAISKLDEYTLNNSIPAEETERLRALAVEKLINRERNKAAKIFLAAKKSDDPIKKKELLESSRDILQSLIEKYPESNLIEKLQNNLSMVKKELDNQD